MQATELQRQLRVQFSMQSRNIRGPTDICTEIKVMVATENNKHNPAGQVDSCRSCTRELAASADLLMRTW